MNLSGQTLGDYQLQSIISQGPRATVYRARQLPVDRIVAVKVYDESVDPDDVRRAAEATQALTHAHVLTVHDTGVHRGLGYVAMRHMPVGSLKARWRRHVPLSDMARIVPQIASALDHAHAHSLLHLNLKPANVLLDHPGNGFIADFGMSALAGSPYTAPEVGRNGRADARADVYGLGAVLYEMATGHAPAVRRPQDERENQRMTELPAPRSLHADVPAAVEEVILRAMSIDPESRYASPGALAEAFTAAVESAAAEQAPAETRRRLPAIGWMAAGLVGLVALVAVIVASSGANAPGAAPVPTASATLQATVASAPAQSPSLAPAVSPTVASTRAPTPSTAATLPGAASATASGPAPTASAVALRSVTPVAVAPTRSPSPAFTVVSLILKPPANRVSPPDRLDLIFDAVLRPTSGGPFGQLFAYVPEIDGLVTQRVGAQVTSGTQVLRVTLIVDCAQFGGPLTTDKVLLEIRQTDRSPTLYATSIDYTKQWCR